MVLAHSKRRTRRCDVVVAGQIPAAAKAQTFAGGNVNTMQTSNQQITTYQGPFSVELSGICDTVERSVLDRGVEKGSQIDAALTLVICGAE